MPRTRMSLRSNRVVVAFLLATGLVAAAIAAVQTVAANFSIPIRFGEDQQCRDAPPGAGQWLDYVQTSFPPQSTCIYANRTVEFIARDELARIGALALLGAVVLTAAVVFLALRLRAFNPAAPEQYPRHLLLAVAIVVGMLMFTVGHVMVTGAIGPVAQSER